jgi:2-polyprenyl-6-methoxyphenol hydroxylase-like FAD-dependent oxidoreductase
LKKAEALIKDFRNELTRVRKLVEVVAGDAEDLNDKNGGNDLLAPDLKMLATAIDDAKSARGFAKTEYERAKGELETGKAQNDDNEEWKLAVRNLGAALQRGQDQLMLCERHAGTAEGGIVYIKNAIARMEALAKRVDDVDEELLDKVKEKIELLPECDNVPRAEGEELDMVKQLVFVSGLLPAQIRTLLGKKFDTMVQALIKGPQLSTAGMTGMLANCHQIVVDAERYYGTRDKFKNSLEDNQKPKFTKVCDVAKQDLNKYTVPYTKPPEGGSKLDSAGVAVVGGGPVGLLAAVEARMAGAAKVHVYEGRTDPYSRMNVIGLNDQAIQRFRSAGIYDLIWPKGRGGAASTKTIEEALEARALALGIKLERGKSLENVTKDEQGRTLLHFKGDDDPLLCDFLIVATGSSVAKKYANKDALSQKLGIAFQKSQVCDRAAIGLFKQNVPLGENLQGTESPEGWQYKIPTEEVKYIVTQLSEDEFDEYSKKPEKLRDLIHGQMGRDEQFFEFEDNKDNKKKPVYQFTIDIQQALQFSSEEGNAVLVGDSAGTPHPATSLGLNTGVAEMGALRDLVQGLDEDGQEDEEKKKKLLQQYEWEVKRRTDLLVNEAMKKMEEEAKKRVVQKVWVKNIKSSVKGVAEDEYNRIEPILKAYVETLCTKPEDVENDRDWSIRERAIKELRDFEKDLRQSHKAIKDYLESDLSAVDDNTKQTEVKRLLKEHIPGA